MIRVSLAALVTIYLLVFLAAVFLVWLSSEWNRRRRERKAFRYRLRCVIKKSRSRFAGVQTRGFRAHYHQKSWIWTFIPGSGLGLMKNSSDEAMTPLKQHAVEALRRARKLPIGPHRNDLRQLAIGLRRLDREGIGANFRDPEIGLQRITVTAYQG